MGADGGSIPKRDELVKTKAKQVKHEKALLNSFMWLYCALSKEPLQTPIVSCCLGRLYNRESVIHFLLDRTAFGDVDTICGHITSLKDVKTLILTKIPEPTQTPLEINPVRPQYRCPLTNMEMNGGHQFVYLRCGHVISQIGLTESKDTAQGGLSCPVCTVTYLPTDIVQLNPPPEQVALLVRQMREKKTLKRSKKRKMYANNEDQSIGGEKRTKMISN